MIREISIRNFKTLKDVKLENIRRINLIIGSPNSGKSNFLEALTILNPINFLLTKSPMLIDKKIIRINSPYELFYFKNIQEKIYIDINKEFSLIIFDYVESVCGFLIRYQDKLKFEEELEQVKNLLELTEKMKGKIFYSFSISKNLEFKFYKGNFGIEYLGEIEVPKPLNSVKRYYHLDLEEKERYNFYYPSLIPPYGKNIFGILNRNREVYERFRLYLQKIGYEIYEDVDDKEYYVVKKKEGKIIRLSYLLLADTLRNYIFYLSAIHSSENSTLIFEEPESKVFPPFIFEMAKDIYYSENQFFISTHNPYLFRKLVREGKENKDVAVLLFKFENEETKIIDITEKIYQEEDLDPFLNTEYFSKK
ncbi:MAG: AAA family ATPase [candidate division WOR-3 bacterium]